MASAGPKVPYSRVLRRGTRQLRDFWCCRVLGGSEAPTGIRGSGFPAAGRAMAYPVALPPGVPAAPGSSDDVAFRISSANLRWLASSCSAKS